MIGLYLVNVIVAFSYSTFDAKLLPKDRLGKVVLLP